MLQNRMESFTIWEDSLRTLLTLTTLEDHDMVMTGVKELRNKLPIRCNVIVSGKSINNLTLDGEE